MSCKVEHTKAHLTKLKRDTKVKVLQSELNIKIMEITEEQIKEAHNAACSQWKQKIEQWFPECFKTEYEISEWYKTKTGYFNYQLENKSYGTNNDNWVDWSWVVDDGVKTGWVIGKATTEEVESMLIKEAEKRGLIEGVKINKLDNFYYGVLNTMIIGKPKLELDGDILVTQSTNNYTIALFNEGKWATIVETPKEMTLEEIEKQLGHKVKIVS